MNSVVYLSNSRIPSSMANSVQIMKMCEAMSLTGSKVTLVKPKRYNEFQNDKFNLFNFYDIKHAPEQHQTTKRVHVGIPFYFIFKRNKTISNG